jgi:hypothetical protein
VALSCLYYVVSAVVICNAVAKIIRLGEELFNPILMLILWLSGMESE